MGTEATPAAAGPAVVAGGLQRRLMLLLLLPFGLVGVVGAWFHYQAAGTAAAQQDQQLLRLAPMLGDSVVSAQDKPDASDPLQLPRPLLLVAPPVEEFLNAREGFAGYSILSRDGQLLLGDAWLPTVLPATPEPEFLSMTEGGVTYRVIAQRVSTAAGELIVQIADGSDARQQWLQIVLNRVLLPNIVLMLAAGLGVHWAVGRALKPLMELKVAVERRSPRDLSPIDAGATPIEVRPLVHSLNRLFELVNAQTEAQRRFVADAAHQLRTPLAGLQAQIEAWGQAARGLSGHDTLGLKVEQVMRLRAASRRTSQLANQLLALSRADATTAASSAMQRVDLKALCENVLGLYLDEAAGKRIDLGLEVEPVQVDGHEWLLRELLINLVDNAIKYTPQDGHVTLRCGWQARKGLPPEAVLEVEDNGPGIAADERHRVLQRFYRMPGTATEGNGLGLAIADEIARAHATHLVLGDGAGGQGLRIRVQFQGPGRQADRV
jgi:two-component system sensor histidine kinase TctE